jgi:hypothetical protein
MDAEPPPPSINPYAAPAVPVDTVDAGAASTLDLTRDEVSIFVGKNSGYYWRVWQQAAPNKELLLKFNWAALFFNLSWLLYRKMYREFLIGFGAIIGLGLAVGVVGVVAGTNLDGFDRVLNLGVAVAVGMLGNGLYLRKARRVITAARAEEPQGERRTYRLAARGGTSWLAAILGAVGGAAISALARG